MDRVDIVIMGPSLKLLGCVVDGSLHLVADRTPVLKSLLRESSQPCRSTTNVPPFPHE